MFLMKVHAEGWVTIRGAKVFIGGNGKITQGPAKFIGSTLNDLGGSSSSPSTAKSSASGSAKATAPKKEKATTTKAKKETAPKSKSSGGGGSATKEVALTKSQQSKYDSAVKHGASKGDAMGYANGTHSKRTIEKAIITGKPAKEAKDLKVASDIRVFIPKGWE